MIFFAVFFLWIVFCGYQWNWGLFKRLHDVKISKYKGNKEKYDIEKVQIIENSNMKGKKIIFLGSSVTYGAASQGISFADYICKRHSCIMVKEAVSGTTLVDNGLSSYVCRLKEIKEKQADLFVCQLSTNDATQRRPLGTVGEGTDIAGFDTKTVAGAIEYIITYVHEKWNCPIVFFTNPKYDSAEYGKMVELLLCLAEKWEINVIDLWNNDQFNHISDVERELYMADAIHPTKAGYLKWWVPYFESGFEIMY